MKTKTVLLRNYSFVVDTYYGYAKKFFAIEYIYADGAWNVNKETEVAELGTSETKPETPSENDTYTVYTTKWVTVTPEDPNALYQVPVMKVAGLPYGNYRAEIKAIYEPIFDNISASTDYDFYLDAIRIYDPAGTAESGIRDKATADAYMEDHELFPEYYEVRNWLISADTFNSLGKDLDGNTDTTEGIVFIDAATTEGPGASASVSDYSNVGPNNELYLTPGQAVAFDLNAGVGAPAGYVVDTVQLALKTVGGTGYSKVWDADVSSVNTVTAKTISTATDMYYDITDLNGKTVVIMNAGGSGDSVLSVTNVKVTYKLDETAVAAYALTEETDVVENSTSAAVFTISRTSAENAISTMCLTDDDDTTDDNITDGGTTGDDTTDDGTIDDGSSDDNTNVIVEIIKTVVSSVVHMLKKLFGL